ncbi:MAG TPA: PucR family transcriptional regulator ligand-binding domain-containing protein [Jatrophihabitans sp.]
MRLCDLIAVPELKLRLENGSEAQLEQAISWVSTTDLLEPGRYLSGGELVVTGMIWHRTAEDSETFVADVARSGAVAIAAGEAVFGEIPDDVLQACRRHDLPLIAVPTELSFAAVTECVVAALTAAKGARLEASLWRQRQLLAAVAEGRGVAELTDEVFNRTGRHCRVLTATGRQIVAGPSPLAAQLLDRIVRTALLADRLPAVVDGGGAHPYSIFGVGSGLSRRLTSWFVVAEGDAGEWDADVVEAVGELAAIAAVDRARQYDSVQAARHIADDAVTLVDAGRGAEPETMVRLRQAGLDPSAPMVVVVAGFPGRPDQAEIARDIFDDLAAQWGRPVVSSTSDAQVVALLPDGVTDELSAAMNRLAVGLGRSRLAVGISEPAPATALSGALNEARHARRLAELRTGAVSIVTGAEVSSHVLLLATVPDDVRRTFAARVLGDVIDYDAQHDSGLIDTLEVFLDCSCSWSRAAEAMHLHLNTVRYRISRVEQLTGRDLSRLEDRVDVFLALRSR